MTRGFVMPMNEEQEIAAFEQMLINSREIWYLTLEDTDFKMELIIPRTYDSESLHRITQQFPNS